MADALFGLTPEAKYFIETTANKTAEAAAQEAVRLAFEARTCPRDCERVESLSEAVFGRSEKGLIGMDERLRTVERSLGYAARALWISIGALIVAGVGVFVKG